MGSFYHSYCTGDLYKGTLTRELPPVYHVPDMSTVNPRSTGYGPALFRAMENLLPEDKRLFDDPSSEKLLSPSWKFWFTLTRL
ncbi:MAG: hypothetical protein P8105_06060, partial [Dehalococcoidia bacterium]